MPEVEAENLLPDVICLMGTGRSGTTILEILLCNSEGICGVGEAVHIFRDGFMRNVRCSCGAATRVCPLWSEVRQRSGWIDASDQRHDLLFRRYAWHSRFPILALGLDSRSAREEFRRVNHQLFSAIRCVSHAEAVVDSSKYAGRALMLARVFPRKKVRIICVTRSPEGLIKAFRKDNAGEQLPKTLFATCTYYFYVLACLRVVAWWLGDRVLHLRYDELARDPAEALARVGQFLGRDLGSTIKKVSNHQWLGIDHIVTGNRIRLDGRIVFRPVAREARLTDGWERLGAWLMNAYRRVLRF